jgi:hypothetical protein
MLSQIVSRFGWALWFIQAFVSNIAGMTPDAYGRTWGRRGRPLIRRPAGAGNQRPA